MDRGVFLWVSTDQRAGAEKCVHTHEQRAVFRAERNWLVNAKFLLNAGSQLKEGRGKKVILKKGIVHLLFLWCQALLRACCFQMNFQNLWLFKSDSSEKCNYTRGTGEVIRGEEQEQKRRRNKKATTRAGETKDRLMIIIEALEVCKLEAAYLVM